MRIHGSNDYGPKADASDASRKERGPSAISRARPTDGVAQGERGGDGASVAKVDASGGEAVVLSASASRLAEASNVQSDGIEARLAEVKRLIAEGAYEIDFDRLTDNLLSEEVGRSE